MPKNPLCNPLLLVVPSSNSEIMSLPLLLKTIETILPGLEETTLTRSSNVFTYSPSMDVIWSPVLIPSLSAGLPSYTDPTTAGGLQG